MFEVKMKITEKIMVSAILGIIVTSLTPFINKKMVLAVSFFAILFCLLYFILNKISRKVTFEEKMKYGVYFWGKKIEKEVGKEEYISVYRTFKNMKLRYVIKDKKGLELDVTDFLKIDGFKEQMELFFGQKERR